MDPGLRRDDGSMGVSAFLFERLGRWIADAIPGAGPHAALSA